MIVNHREVHRSVYPDEGAVYADCVNHCRDWKTALVPGSKTSSAHELTHFINAEARNRRGAGYETRFVKSAASLAEDGDGAGTYSLLLPLPVPRPYNPALGSGRDHSETPAAASLKPLKRINCLYLRRNRLLVLPEPPIRKSQVAAHVPPAFRGSRYSVYITGQNAWDSTPLYVWDEWVAYLSGAACAWDLAGRGMYHEEGRDILYGVLEFIVYGTALMRAVAAADEKAHQELVPSFHLLLDESLDLWYTARDRFHFSGQDRYFEAWRAGQSGKVLRDYYATIGYRIPTAPKGPGDRPDHALI